MTKNNFDVLILGGGFAGATLALDLLRKRAGIRLAVVDKRSFPLAAGEGAVGESLVEIATHYLSDNLDLKNHLETEQLPKLGLRYFLESDNNHAIEKRLEVGGNRYAPTPSFQIDRARLENHLYQEILSRGGEFVDRARVRQIKISKDRNGLHSADFFCRIDGEGKTIPKTYSSRWLIDATGRAGLLRKKLGLQEKNNHYGNAAWWRFQGKFPIDEWCDDPAWKQNNQGKTARWFSTNHLMGQGYWVWIIPLSSSRTSFGIVADPSLHDFQMYNTFERALSWLENFEPQLAKFCTDNRDKLQDFRSLKNYSYGSVQVFSSKRWALAGEAGVFPDPFYSPGNDFIAISNSYIVDLIERDLSGESITGRASIYNDLYLKIFNSTLTTFKGQYPIIGNPLVMPIKVFWDWSYYWHFLARLFFEDRLTDLSFIVKNRDVFERFRKLNEEMQALFLEWNKRERPKAEAGFFDLAKHSYLFQLNASLSAKNDPRSFPTRFQADLENIESIASEIKHCSENKHPNQKKIFTPYFQDLKTKLSSPPT